MPRIRTSAPQRISGAHRDSWMPIYWGDYLRDTMHLSTELHGAYLLLIAAYWCCGSAVPDNDFSLQNITRLNDEKWLIARPILEKFFKISDGFWRHSRIDKEIQRVRHIAKVKQKAGRMGGKTAAQRQQKGTYPQPQPHLREKKEISEEKKGKTAPSKKDGDEFFLACAGSENLVECSSARSIVLPQKRKTESDAEFEEWFREYPKRVGKGHARRAYRTARGKTDHSTLMAGARRESERAAMKDPQFTPHPTTWLNGERWLDEAAPSTINADFFRSLEEEIARGKHPGV